MKVLVDTCVWSQALRRKHLKDEQHQLIAETLIELIAEERAEIIGPIRQELLSGISSEKQYVQLRDKLRAFSDIEIASEDFERAAEMANICRSSGVQGSHRDFLICAISEKYHLSIFTTDDDFKLYAKYLPILLFLLP